VRKPKGEFFLTGGAGVGQGKGTEEETSRKTAKKANGKRE